MIRVVLDGLTRRVDKVAVVDGASLEVRPGELTVLAGPSGAGKSTIARLIAGLERPDEGSIYFDGRDVTRLPPAQRKVGVAWQGDALWPQLTVAENLDDALRPLKLPRRARKKRVADALGQVGIDALADKRPAALSMPQARRVALARALVAGPDLLVLDDPIGDLPERDRAALRDEILRVVAEAEVSTLVLTADPREALAMADRLAVIDLGRVVQVGPPRELYHDPADAFVARFLGPANILQGHLEGVDARGEAVVRTPIGRLVGRAPKQPIDVGSPVTVAIRPESLGLGPTVPPGSNRFAATLERQIFLGQTRQVDLRGPGDWPMTALTLTSQGNGLREGQPLTVSVAPEQVIILPSKFGAGG